MSKVKQIDVTIALEDLVGQRFNKETLEAKLSTIFKQPIIVEDISREDDELSDYNLLTEFGNADSELYGYVDIYFLPMRKEGFDKAIWYITEIAVEFE
jgi:hypothetical protein